MIEPIADYVIVGGGTAGCVLAERLSRDGSQVVLVEAGPDTPPGATPANILDIYPSSQADPSYFWPLDDVKTGLEQAGGVFRPIWRFGQARVLGGGGSVMGMIALRGLASDYDAWSSSGCRGWSWADVLPYFRCLEADVDFTGELHGISGPIPIRRVMPQHWPQFLHVASRALAEQGHQELGDMNGEVSCGFGPTPKSCTPAERVCSAQAYLTQEVRSRPNLRVRTGVRVRQIVFEGKRATGVVIDADGGSQIPARTVILSAGAIASPALLLRSGVGPADQLRSAGIDTVSDLPGVGANLQNHPMLTIAAHLRPEMRQSRAVREMCSLWLRYSSGVPGCPEADMAGNILASIAPSAAASGIGGVGATIYKPHSLGSVRLASADPYAAPEIRFNLLSDDRDRQRMAEALARCLGFLAQSPVREAVTDVFIPDPSWPMRLGGRGPLPAIKNEIVAKALDIGLLRRHLLGRNRLDVDALLRDRSAVDEIALAITGLGGHVAGTCRMGDIEDPATVVDPCCRVKGMAGLRVIDASIMPRLVAANTNLPVQMIAERAADLVLADGNVR